VYEAACKMYDLITTDSASARISIAKETKIVATTLHILDYINCLIELLGSQKNSDTYHIYISKLIQAKQYITSNVSKEHALYGALTS
jgi:hypothetical protein